MQFGMTLMTPWLPPWSAPSPRVPSCCVDMSVSGQWVKPVVCGWNSWQTGCHIQNSPCTLCCHPWTFNSFVKVADRKPKAFSSARTLPSPLLDFSTGFKWSSFQDVASRQTGLSGRTLPIPLTLLLTETGPVYCIRTGNVGRSLVGSGLCLQPCKSAPSHRALQIQSSWKFYCLIWPGVFWYLRKKEDSLDMRNWKDLWQKERVS